MFVRKFIQDKIFKKEDKKKNESIPITRLNGNLGDTTETVIDSMKDFSPSDVTEYNRYVQFWKDGYEASLSSYN